MCFSSAVAALVLASPAFIFGADLAAAEVQCSVSPNRRIDIILHHFNSDAISIGVDFDCEAYYTWLRMALREGISYLWAWTSTDRANYTRWGVAPQEGIMCSRRDRPRRLPLRWLVSVVDMQSPFLTVERSSLKARIMKQPPITVEPGALKAWVKKQNWLHLVKKTVLYPQLASLHMGLVLEQAQGD